MLRLPGLYNYRFCYENGKKYPHVYLEERRYKIKKIEMSDFINAKLELGSSSDSELMLFFYSQCYLLFVGYVLSDA